MSLHQKAPGSSGGPAGDGDVPLLYFAFFPTWFFLWAFIADSFNIDALVYIAIAPFPIAVLLGWWLMFQEYLEKDKAKANQHLSTEAHCEEIEDTPMSKHPRADKF